MVVNSTPDVVGSDRISCCVHGGLDTGTNWARHTELLASNWHVIAPDSRGHGLSTNPGGDLRYSLMADDMAALCGVLGIQHIAAWGHSDGGLVALQIALRHPELLTALILDGVPHRFDSRCFAALDDHPSNPERA